MQEVMVAKLDLIGKLAWKYFSKTSNQQSAAAEQNSKACIGLTNEKIENYVIKNPAEFGGSKNDYVIAKRLFPKKFPENSKFSYSQKNHNN